MPADPEPAWLLAWRTKQGQPPPVAVPRPPPPKPDGPKVPLRMRGQALAIGIVEPDPWPFDGCKRREAVFDIDYGQRVVRKVGWHRCLKCGGPFFSEDVVRLRLCSGLAGCRGDEDRYT